MCYVYWFDPSIHGSRPGVGVSLGMLLEWACMGVDVSEGVCLCLCGGVGVSFWLVLGFKQSPSLPVLIAYSCQQMFGWSGVYYTLIRCKATVPLHPHQLQSNSSTTPSLDAKQCVGDKVSITPSLNAKQQFKDFLVHLKGSVWLAGQAVL